MASSEGPKSNLHQQDLTKLDVTKLSALSPEVISRQATINIGTIGHVAHGKSTVVKAISGVQTVRFKNELERNITIKLERVSDSIIKMYQDRSKEKDENLFIEKINKSRIRNLSFDSEDEENLPRKKSKTERETDEYIIEKILKFKFESGQEYFYVKWQGWPDSENTWEPKENLNNCPDVLQEFLNEIELKYCDRFDKLKQEISFGDLLSEENILVKFSEVDFHLLEVPTLKNDLLIKLLSMILLKENEECHADKIVQDTRIVLQMYVMSRRRCRQLIDLRNWENHLNQVDKWKKITVENEVDFTGPPENFTYINECIPGAGVVIPKDPPIGCECVTCHSRSCCGCGMQGGIFAYTTNKRLRIASGVPVFECNKACKCSSDCSNRVVQSGRNVKVCIFRTANGCGWGVRSEQKIKQGQFICQYVGEVITFEEAEKRGREYDANGLTYLFDLDFNSVDNNYTVDAAHLGNVSHFINHSCNPNLAVWAVWGDCLDPNLPMLAFFTTRDIEAGEELCFDYLQKSSENDENGQMNDGPSSTGKSDDDDVSIPSVSEPATAVATMSPLKSHFENQQHNTNLLRNKTECKCGALKCRRYLF